MSVSTLVIKELLNLSQPELYWNVIIISIDLIECVLCFQGGDLTEKIKAWKKSGRTFDESLIVAWLVQLLLAIQFIHKK
jgi:hypothetical protein